MLVLSRRPGQVITIGDDIRVIIVEERGGKIRVGVEAPKHVEVDREEIYRKKRGLPPLPAPAPLKKFIKQKHTKGRGNDAPDRSTSEAIKPVLPPRS